MPDKLKIGFDAKRAFQNKTGLGNYSRNVINGMSESFPQNEYVLFTPEDDYELFFPPPSIKVEHSEGFFWNNFKSLWRSYKITDLAKKEKLDIYHGLSHELPIGIQKTGIKTVVTIHDLIFIRFPEFYRSFDRYFYSQKYKYACTVADKITAISQQTKNDLVDLFHISEDKIEVVYQSVKPLYFQKNTVEELEDTLKQHKIPKEYILVPGTIEARKNLKNILRAVENLNIDLPLVIVGRPTGYMKELQPQIRRMGKKLIFLHNINDQQLSHLYQSALLTIYASVFEGFGLPVAEAQACGCPVLASGASSITEAGGESACYINPYDPTEIADGILKIIENRQTRNEIIDAGLKNAERFHLENQAKKLMDIYQNL